MNRTELIIIMSATLFAAFVLGWLLRWAFGRLNQVNSVDVAEIDNLASRLHDAEEQLAATRNALVQKEAELTAAMDGLGHVRRENEAFREQLEQIRATEDKILHAIEDNAAHHAAAKAETEPAANDPAGSPDKSGEEESGKPARNRGKSRAKD